MKVMIATPATGLAGTLDVAASDESPGRLPDHAEVSQLDRATHLVRRTLQRSGHSSRETAARARLLAGVFVQRQQRNDSSRPVPAGARPLGKLRAFAFELVGLSQILGRRLRSSHRARLELALATLEVLIVGGERGVCGHPDRMMPRVPGRSKLRV